MLVLVAASAASAAVAEFLKPDEEKAETLAAGSSLEVLKTRGWTPVAVRLTRTLSSSMLVLVVMVVVGRPAGH